MSQRTWQRITVRLPEDCTEFLAVAAKRNAASQNSEIVKSIRLRIEAEKTDRPSASTPGQS